MIYVGENKSTLFKGDFRPAELYKGDKKIAGYAVTEFESSGGATLENCYNDNIYNAVIYGRSTRSGTPTINNPIELQSVGEKVTEGEYAGKYKVSIKASGENGQTQTFDIYLDAPLRKIGDFGDYIDFEKGVVVRNIGKKEFTGKEGTWQAHDTKNFLFYETVNKAPTSEVNNIVAAMSNRLQSQMWTNLYQNINRANGSLITGVSCTYKTAGSQILYIYVCPFSTQPTIAEWKTQLNTWYKEGNPFTVWYVKASTQEAIELPKLPTFKGITIYEIDTQITATISGKYKKQEVE